VAVIWPGGLELSARANEDAAGLGGRRVGLKQSADQAVVSHANTAGIAVIVLSPSLGAFNEDLRVCVQGPDHLRSALRVQMAPQDIERL
jgi:hypothetical protein